MYSNKLLKTLSIIGILSIISTGCTQPSYNEAAVQIYNIDTGKAKLVFENDKPIYSIIDIDSIKFKNNSSFYTSNTIEIKKLKNVKKIIEKGNFIVLIEGHTNSISTAKYNMYLSQKRATKVMNDLIKLGLDKSSIKAIGLGEGSPEFDNSTKKGLASNRSVIIKTFKNIELVDTYISTMQDKINNPKEY